MVGTDPQSTVPVEPQDAEEYRADEIDIGDLSDYQRGYIDGFDAPVNVAARASQPITATADSGEPIELAELLREFRLRSSLEHNKSEASRLVWATAYDMLAALPVREDEPTGIDRLRALIEQEPKTFDISRQRLLALIDEASHVR